MTLPLELGGVSEPHVRRAFENIAQIFPLAPINELGAIPTGTATLPSPAVNGQDFYYALSAGGVWHFKYNATSTKWDFAGGPPLYSEVTTTQGTTSITYAALATAGPSVVLPFAGDYTVSIGARIEQTVAAAYAGFMSYDIGGTGAVDGDAIVGTSSGVSDGANNFRTRVKTGLTAVTLTAKYRAQIASNVNFTDRHIYVTPVRVG